jgi:hypothetical protein
MPAIPLLGGMKATTQAEFVESPPVNLEPIILANGISNGQFRAMAGAVQKWTGQGVDRGAIVRSGRHYRISGTKLIEMAANGPVVIGDVGGTGPVSIDYGFDRVAVRSGTNMFYVTDTGLTQVTDPDLGPVLDLLWVDGYYMTTDGTSIVVTELSDPTAIEPLKYGSAEEDPDMVTGLMELGTEVHAFGRFTVQPFQNVGGNGFPFQAIRGAMVRYGCVSANAKCYFADTIAFVGSAKNEALGVYLLGSGTATKISNRALDLALAKIADPSVIECEARAYADEQRLLVHLPHETWVFHFEASQRGKDKLWTMATSGDVYRLRHAVELNGEFWVGDAISAKIGVLSHDTMTHFGDDVEWRFDTQFLHNAGFGFILKALELVALTGRGAFGEGHRAFLSLTRDGIGWSRERMVSTGAAGETRKRLVWRPLMRCGNYLGLRFRGFGKDLPGFVKIEADIEPLNG